jgi:hypothetical protein
MRGGLNNLRNRLQTCVRLAISAGAGVIVILASHILLVRGHFISPSIINTF